MQFHVSTLQSSDNANALKQTLQTSEPEATVNIDVDQKLIIVQSDASRETFQQLITAAGHQVD